MKGKPFADVAKRAVDAHNLVGADKMLKPAKSWGPEQWAAFYEQAGRPKTAAEYPKPENLPAEAQLDDQFFERFNKIAHTAGLNTRQAAELAREFAGFRIESGKAMTDAMAAEKLKNETALKTEWGAAYDQNLLLVKDAITRFGGDELFAELSQNPLGNNPLLIKALAAVGKAVAEDKIIGRGTPAPSLKSPTEAAKEMDRLQADPEFFKAWTDANNPGHKDAVARMQELSDMAHPPKPKN